MSCLNLKRLLPHRKVWKVLTRKLPLKLSKSKPNKKLKNRFCKTSKKLGWPFLSIQPKKFKNKPRFHTLIRQKNYHYCFQKRPPPVFVDQLFIEPISIVKEHVLPPEETSKEYSCSSGSSLNRSEILDRRSMRPESMKEEGVIDDHSPFTVDDVWESMVLASPQMHGINEQAEEFIARFRAEMHRQEMLARRL